ncbi:TPA: hypothetical protein ACTLRO_003238 [Klebsiella pneumoniae]|uniref:hypothetical protein n=1 Tax=Klebsiella pneumoniae TaxID=573 RepID=UPI000DE76958|nr:hypothetical protein [Klebsiella pneumoniae]MCW8285582.1 hypothetical protein [Klebsiella pneumoniae]SSK15659.1 Uncharacterised protein [Klebsiella pneumoniae]HBQ0625152.1 hypothetical protein [Klebsiella pneumoniae]
MLESLKEYFSSTINTAANRIRNPVFGAFALSWCAFNWKSILYLFLSDYGVYDKINYISENSSWLTVILYPIGSAIFLCGLLPWVNNYVSAWQDKPLDNSDSIENHRKAKRILRATRLQRLKAKHDVTYDRVRTGAEKDIQTMKEDITKSQERMGELTEEIDTLKFDNNDLTKLNSGLGDKVRYLEATIHNTNIENEKLKKQLDEIKGYFNIETKTLVDRTIPITNTNSNGMADFFRNEANNHSHGS